MSPPTTPMPRRQSCDRCHNQKVRCFTDGPDEIFTPGGTADDQVNSNGHFVSHFPCRRCRKAGALCVFSRMLGDAPVPYLRLLTRAIAQLRSGRPRLPRNSPPGCRKRVSTSATPLSTRPPLSPTRSTSNSPLPISNPYFSLTTLVDPEPYSSLPDAQTTCQTLTLDAAGMMTPVSHLGTEDQGTLVGLSPWLVSPFNPNNVPVPYPDAMYILGSSALSAPDATDCNPTLLKASSATSAARALPDADFVWHNHGLDFEDHFGELGQIRKRICQIARTTLPNTTSRSSPLVDDIFEAGCSLVNLTDRYTASRRFELDSWPSPLSTHIDLSDSLKTSFCLMAMACQQIILALFQELLEPLVDSFESTPQSRRPSETPAITTTETDMTLKLAIHLLGQFDLSLAGLLTVTGADKESRSPSSPSFSHSFDDIGNATQYQQYGVAATAFQQVDQRKKKLQTLVCTVRNLVEQTVVV
jgi:hypothetical protein